jgi:hypothetical protein
VNRSDEADADHRGADLRQPLRGRHRARVTVPTITRSPV